MSHSSEYDLVSFENPPVAEVALCFQFAPNTVDLDVLAMFSERVREELPSRALQPLAPPMIERFDQPGVPTFNFQLDPPAALPRVWFTSADGVQLVQLQHDRLTLNWRELHTGAAYPRYSQLREKYADTVRILGDCLETLGRPWPKVSLAEVTYVNHIDAPAEAGRPTAYADLADIINRLHHRPDGAFLPDAEDVQLNARWRISDGDGGGEPIGRLYLSAMPGLKPPTNMPIYIVTLLARVLPKPDGDAEAWKALDHAHRWVVLGFTDVTTERMQQIWRRERREVD